MPADCSARSGTEALMQASANQRHHETLSWFNATARSQRETLSAKRFRSNDMRAAKAQVGASAASPLDAAKNVLRIAFAATKSPSCAYAVAAIRAATSCDRSLALARCHAATTPGKFRCCVNATSIDESDASIYCPSSAIDD